MGDLIGNIEHTKEQALESMFHQLRDAFRETFKQIVPIGDVDMKLQTTTSVPETQRTYPSQYLDTSQKVAFGGKIIKNIRVYVDFKGQGIGDFDDSNANN